MRMRRLCLGWLLLVSLFAFVYAGESSIDVFYPNGFGVTSGGNRPLAMNTSRYNLNFNLSKGQMDSLLIPNSQQPTRNIFSTGSSIQGLTLAVADINNKMYYSTLATADNDGILTQSGADFCYNDHMYCYEAGKHYYRLVIKNISFRAADNAGIPLQAQLILHVYQDRIFGEIWFVGTSTGYYNKVEARTIVDPMRQQGKTSRRVFSGGYCRSEIKGSYPSMLFHKKFSGVSGS